MIVASTVDIVLWWWIELLIPIHFCFSFNGLCHSLGEFIHRCSVRVAKLPVLDAKTTGRLVGWDKIYDNDKGKVQILKVHIRGFSLPKWERHELPDRKLKQRIKKEKGKWPCLITHRETESNIFLGSWYEQIWWISYCCQFPFPFFLQNLLLLAYCFLIKS